MHKQELISYLVSSMSRVWARASSVFLFICVATSDHIGSGSNFTYPAWALNRTEPISNSGPFAFEFNKKENEAGRQGLFRLINHFEDVGKRVAKAVRSDDYVFTRRRMACNVSNLVSVTSINVRMHTLDFGDFDSTCITELDSDNHDTLWVALDKVLLTIDASIAAVLCTTIRGRPLAEPMNPREKWERGYSFKRHKHNRTFNKCSLIHISGFRVRGKWAVAISATSDKPNLFKGNRQRQYINEFLTRKGLDSVGNMQMHVNGTMNGVVCRIPCTTTLSSWGGTPASLDHVEVLKIEENPAVRAALFAGKRWKQQAADSMSASNIAIVMVSLLLVLVPVAFFADVSPIVLLAYAICTDVFSCLPLAIKGIELMKFSGITHKATLSWAYGLETPQALGSAELWIARCKSPNKLFITGAVFISVAVVAITVGVSLEFYTRKRLKRAKDYNHVLLSSARNTRLQEIFARETRCKQCTCYAVLIDISQRNLTFLSRSGGIFLVSYHRRALESILDTMGSG